MIIYLVKSTLLLGLLFGLYKLLLENEKMHRFNRFFLLFALVFGLTAPLISFEIQPEQSIAGIQMQQVERVVNAPAEAVNRSVQPLFTPEQGLSPGSESTPNSVNESNWSIGTLDVILALYGAITLFLLIRFAAGLNQIRNKVRAGTRKKLEDATLVLLEEPITPQSFLDYIFIEKQPFESGKIEPEILDHEFTHVRQFHSFDVLLIEFLKVIFWFNPLMYLYKHAIQLNHEFLADEAVVRSGSSISDYQELLIRVSSGNNSLKTTSSINYSLTRKRLKMMGKKISKLKVGAVWLFLLPLSVALIIVFSSKTDNPVQNSNTIYFVPELHLDSNRSEELGIPSSVGAHFTSSGEPFTGTQKIYYIENDSLYMEMFYKDGINTGSRMTRNGDVIRQVHGVYNDDPHLMEMYRNGNLIYKDIPPSDSNDRLWYTRMWHDNGQLALEVYHSGDNIGDKMRQGLLTEYDEDGNITMQERYENGELIETIK